MRDHQNVHRRSSKNTKRSGRHTRYALNSFANQRNDRDIGDGRNAIDPPAIDLRFEFTPQRLHGLIAIVAIHHKRYVLLRRALRKHQHADSMPCRRREYTPRHAWNADHSASFDGDKGHAGNGCHRLYAVLMGRSLGTNERPRHIGSKRIFDANRNILVHSGHNRLRMKHLCSEIGHLRSFLVRNTLENTRVRNDAGIRCHDSVHIGPNLNFGGLDATADDRGGVVGTSAPECCCDTGRRGANEPGNDRNNAGLRHLR